MALIRQLDERTIDARRIHGEVECGYVVLDIDGVRILQLETYGSPDRQFPGKVSQSLQLDEKGARALKRVIERAFPGI